MQRMMLRRTAVGGAALLDNYPNSIFALSLRRLKTGVTNVVRVRNGLDDTEADYTVEDIEAGLPSLGANDGFVKTFYRQDDGTSHSDLSQSDLTKQPKILNLGSLYLNNSRPYIKFDGINDYLVSTADNAITDQGFTLYCVFKTQANSSTDAVFDEDAITTAGRNNVLSSTNTSLDGFAYAASGAQLIFDDLVAKTVNTVYLSTFRSVAGIGATSKDYFQNGVLQTTANFGNQFADLTTLGLGNRDIAALWFAGEFAEIIIFSDTHDDTTREAIELEIMTYYGI